MKKPRVLLTASYGPNNLGWGEDMYDLLASRLARGHGAFQMTSHCHYFGLYLLAENITNPTTVLENPHWEEFDMELDEGYDYVGIQLKSLHTKKIARMVKRIREKCPGTKIIIGGYGVGTLNHPVPGDKDGDAVYIRENADYLCREEGARFMRRILDDGPEDREITQYHMPTPAFAISGVNWHFKLPIILVSLGCPNACDFCNTSAFFNYKKTYVAEPEQVYRYMKSYQRRFKARDIFTLLFDEDFFLNADYVRELGKLLRNDKKTWGLRYFTFGSVRSLSQFDAEELRDCGLGAVWIGVESFMSGTEQTEDKYGKRSGRSVKDTFEALQKNGIVTIGSMVMGFDFHDKDNLKKDIDQFVALKPTFYQLSPLTPCPGTALYDKLIEEERIFDTYKWEDFNLWKDDAFKLKNFKPGEIKNHFDYAHNKIRDELGPPVLQGMELMLDCYKTLKDTGDKYNAYKVRQTKRALKVMHMYIDSLTKLHNSEEVRKKTRALDKRFHEEIGSAIPFSWIVERFLNMRVSKVKNKPQKQVVSDPPPRWTYYNTFDQRVWVKKGRNAKKPVPYRKGFIVAPIK